MDIKGECKECSCQFTLRDNVIAPGVYECTRCKHPHTLGELTAIIDDITCLRL